MYIDGKLVYPRKTVQEIKQYANEELETLWPEYKRFDRPQLFKVDLSEKLWNLRNDMLNSYKQNGSPY